MSDFSKRFASLSPEKQALLMQQLAQKKHAASAPVVIQAQSRATNRYPLAPSQRRLWFMEQLAPGLSSYNDSAVFYITGALDVEKLQYSLTHLVLRHEILRTRFVAEDGEPWQIIDAPQPQPLPLLDLRALSIAERRARTRQLIDEAATETFDLTRGPLLCTSLVQQADHEYVLLLLTHHIVSDGWSMSILIDDLLTLYHAASTGQPASLPALPIQYADYAVWQRQRLQDGLLEQQLSYWRKALRDAPILQLPTDRPRPSMPLSHGHTYKFRLPARLSAPLHALSQQHGCTLFMTLLTVWKVLLHRYSGQEQIVVGTPVAGRNRDELEHLIGCFLNTLALHTDLAPGMTFREALLSVRETCLEGFNHQDVPFEQVVEALQPPRHPSRHPLFQVMFVLQNMPGSGARLQGIELEPMELSNPTTKFDLSLDLIEAPQGLLGALEYSTDLFDAGTIERLAQHFEMLVGSVVANPDQQISRLTLLTEAERKYLVVENNRTYAPYPRDLCMHQLFEQQARRTPDALAVVCGTEQMTYAELDWRANLLACYLQAHGVGPEVHVGLCLERSLDLIVALLGIWKAGGAYVPIDPAYPQERIRYMLQDAQIAVLLTQQRLVERVSVESLRIICIDRDWPQIAAGAQTIPTHSVTIENLAYIIYTSGSTGRPKGVLIPHQALVARSSAAVAGYGLEPGDRVLQFAALSFDVAAEELFPTLMSGATVVLWPQSDIMPPHEFQRFVAQERLTVLNLPMPYWHVWVADLDAEPAPLPTTLRLVVAGSDQTAPEWLSRWQQRVGTRVLWYNAYGPTEATITSTLYTEGDAAAAITRGSVPIGRPIANTQVYVLDTTMQPVPVGVAGELYIGGAGLARAYHQRPALTAAQFVPDPFGTHAGARLYRTGDRVRYRADGQLEFLGRMDQQIKLRGFRIELGEIEAALLEHEAVREAVVVAREDELSASEQPELRLVAYVVENQVATSSASLRSYLAARLPAYMVPAAFVVLDALPLAPNGKLDRKVLPAPSLSRDAGRVVVAPRTPVERALVRMWEDLLKVSPISIQDNFFDLGGHSFLAVRLMAQIQKQFARRLPLAVLFQHATIDDLSRLIDRPDDQAAWLPLVPIQPQGSQLPFFCVHPIGGNVLCYIDLARALGPDQPFYGLQAVSPAQAGGEVVRIEDMAATYVAAIQKVQPAGPYLIGGWSFGGTVAFEIAQQLRRQNQEVAYLAIFDTFAYTSRDEVENMTDAMAMALLAYEDAILLGKSFPLSIDDLKDLEPDEQLKLVLDHIRRAGLDLASDLEWVQRFLGGYKARQRALYRYQPQPYPGRITLFRSVLHDAEITKIQNQAGLNIERLASGWDRLTDQMVEVYDVAAYHHTIIMGEHAEVIAGHLRAGFKRAITMR